MRFHSHRDPPKRPRMTPRLPDTDADTDEEDRDPDEQDDENEDSSPLANNHNPFDYINWKRGSKILKNVEVQLRRASSALIPKTQSWWAWTLEKKTR